MAVKTLVIRDTSSLLIPGYQRSGILGLVAGFGTTFAAVPDLLAMLKRRSSAGMNPRMAGIIASFKSLCLLWVVHCFAAGDRMEMIGVLINFVSVGAYLHFAREERQ